MRGRAGLLGGTVVALVLLLAGASWTMFRVKPRVSRPALDASVTADIQALETRLMRHVRVLAGDIGERNLFTPDALDAAAAYIRTEWAAQGFASQDEPFVVQGRRVANLVVERPGSARADEILLVGAHYDSILGSPGANDNATGIALLLETSRSLGRAGLPRTLRFVAFVNEEPPFFKTAHMGSRHHARGARMRGERLVAMLSLETLGYYATAPGSQRYPFPLGLFYRDRGDFLGVVGNLASRGLVRTFLAQFMRATDVPVEGAATFAWIPGVDWSDHEAFWREGYPALMLTDTAPYRYPGYHSAADRPERITAPAFARAAHGIIETVRRLATGP